MDAASTRSPKNYLNGYFEKNGAMMLETALLTPLFSISLVA